MNTLKGTPISSGIAIGNVYLKNVDSNEIIFTEVANTEEERKRFHNSRTRAIQQVEDIYTEMLRTKGEEEAAIFSAHIDMLNDLELIKRVEGAIKALSCNAEWAVKTARDEFVEIFEALDDEYMRERAMDIKDISNRIIQILKGNETTQSYRFTEPVIVISSDLTPSDTAQMDPEFVLGILNETGGSTSHAAIIARMLGIPFVVCPEITAKVRMGQLLAFDGENGNIELEVTELVRKEYESKQEVFRQKKAKLEQVRGTKAITGDGFEVKLAGNIGAVQDVDKVLQQDGNSIGLFRTEFLYMNRDMAPDEEEQLIAYKEVAEKMKGHPVIIRTLDIGGDKEVKYLDIEKEENPFLGYRANRLCLDRKSFWKVQLRALLRASVYGDIHIMYPMIVSMEELYQAKLILEEVKAELRSEGIDFNEKIPVGMMMETPAAALMADIFAQEVDFFSIGTNDLIQYTMAVDRMNGSVTHLYSQYDPAVLRLVKHIVESAHQKGIWVGICGEAAADQLLLPLWVGLGVDELSMSPTSILAIRKGIQGLVKTNCEDLVAKAFVLKTAGEIEELLKNV